MSNIFPTSLNNVPTVGTPNVVLGTLYISVPSIVRFPSVSSPAVGNININGFGIANDQQKFGIPSAYSTSQVPEIHSQVEFLFPEFIQEEHRAFIAFIQEYYKFIEKSEGPLHFLRRLLHLQNIDQTASDLLEYFYREYAPTFPRNTVLSPAIIFKNIKQFYVAKGSEKSFEFLFRVFFGTEIEFYYPRLDILRFSDGKWIQNRTIRGILLQGEPSKLIGNRIFGVQSKASAFVENVLITQEGSITVHELFLNASSIVGKFEIDEVVKDESDQIKCRVLPMISEIKITSPGRGYEAGQELSIIGEGFNCKARVGKVSESGGIQSVEIYKFGAGYKAETTSVAFPQYANVIEQASGKPTFNSTVKYPGYFLNSDGTFSDLKYIQDSYYYQQFSYVIRSPESRDRYESIVKNLAHPAGFIFFSEVVLETNIDASPNIPEDLDGNITTNFERFTDYRFDFNEFHVPINEYVFQEVPTSTEDTDVEFFAEDVTYAERNTPMGPTWNDWEKWKTDYRPTPIFGQPTDEIIQPGYYSLYANTPLKAFADVKLADIVFNSFAQIDHLPETTITQEV
jgi:hypothetical protein